MTVLVIFIALTLAACTGLVLVPWSTRDTGDRDAINRALYHDRVRQLTAEPTSEAERAQIVAELQRTLLQDIPRQNPTSVRPHSRWVLLPGVLLLVAVTLGLFSLTTQINQLRDWQRAVDQTSALKQRVLDPQAEALTLYELRQLGLGLRSQLEHHPDDPQAWRLLSRIATVLEDPETAMYAYANAWQRDPNNAELKIDYATLLLTSANPQQGQRGSALLREIIASGSADLSTLSQLAFSAYEGQRYQDAINAWQAMLNRLPEGDKRRAVIERSMAQAENAQGEHAPSETSLAEDSPATLRR